MLNGLLLASAMFISPAPTPAPKPAVSDLIPIELNIVTATNAQRQRHGLQPLTIDPSLMRSARRHCAWMANSGALQHTNQAVGENIAQGQTSSSEAVRDWMNSPGHRANMLNGRYSRIGAAAYTGRNGQIYWCVQFIW